MGDCDCILVLDENAETPQTKVQLV